MANLIDTKIIYFSDSKISQKYQSSYVYQIYYIKTCICTESPISIGFGFSYVYQPLTSTKIKHFLKSGLQKE